MIGKGFQPLQAGKQSACAAGGIFRKFGAPNIADHQGMTGYNEPRLVGPSAIGDQKAYMFRRVAGRVKHIHYDIPEREPVAVFRGMEGKRHFGPGVEHIGPRCAGQRAPSRAMIGVNVGINDEPDAHPRLVRDSQVWFDIA